MEYNASPLIQGRGSRHPIVVTVCRVGVVVIVHGGEDYGQFLRPLGNQFSVYFKSSIIIKPFNDHSRVDGQC